MGPPVVHPSETGGGAEPWIESRAGGLFFVNVVLVTPIFVVLVPLLLGGVLRTVGLVQGPAPVLDTIPLMADYFVPRLGWLAAPAAWVAWTTHGTVERDSPRRWLAAFLGLHLLVVAYTLYRWIAA